MKKTIIIALLACLVSCGHKASIVEMETSAGTIVIKLYDETPLHRDNFLKLAQDHVYDSLLFHRVIKDFMIQGGDTGSKNAEPGVLLGDNDLPYKVPAEFRVDQGIYHKRGVIAAAREGDEENPERASSSTQFYIVWGKYFDDEGLENVQKRIDKSTGGQVKLTDEMKECYKNVGGTPHLDGSYTVFGEVISGLDVVDAIQQAETDENDRPLEDIRILSVRIRS